MDVRGGGFFAFLPHFGLSVFGFGLTAFGFGNGDVEGQGIAHAFTVGSDLNVIGFSGGKIVLQGETFVSAAVICELFKPVPVIEKDIVVDSFFRRNHIGGSGPGRK